MFIAQGSPKKCEAPSGATSLLTELKSDKRRFKLITSLRDSGKDVAKFWIVLQLLFPYQ